MPWKFALGCVFCKRRSKNVPSLINFQPCLSRSDCKPLSIIENYMAIMWIFLYVRLAVNLFGLLVS